MITLGVDLASDPRTTARCRIAWGDGRAVVEDLALGVTDDDLLAAHADSDVTGIDCPFGWPDPFVDLVSSTTNAEPPRWTTDWRDQLRYRLTDHTVHRETGRWPLSVSSDLIAVPAFRCQGLLARMGVTDRSGDGRVFEVYPAAALRRWGLRSTGYKQPRAARQRVELVQDLLRRAPWLDVAAYLTLLATSADALDALVAALVTRAATLGLTPRPEPHDHPRAAREGWIALPAPGSLERLPTAER